MKKGKQAAAYLVGQISIIFYIGNTSSLAMAMYILLILLGCWVSLFINQVIKERP